jgi:hypothetical protein
LRSCHDVFCDKFLILFFNFSNNKFAHGSLEACIIHAAAGTASFTAFLAFVGGLLACLSVLSAEGFIMH